MKARYGFVANSSSSSYITGIGLVRKENIGRFKEYIKENHEDLFLEYSSYNDNGCMRSFIFSDVWIDKQIIKSFSDILNVKNNEIHLGRPTKIFFNELKEGDLLIYSVRSFGRSDYDYFDDINLIEEDLSMIERKLDQWTLKRVAEIKKVLESCYVEKPFLQKFIYDNNG